MFLICGMSVDLKQLCNTVFINKWPASCDVGPRDLRSVWEEVSHSQSAVEEILRDITIDHA
jgi:hypothetical protein